MANNNGTILSNLVETDALRRVQLSVLEKTSSVISKTAGPFGSYSMIMHPDRLTEYSKDGHKVLSNFKFFKPLEKAVHDELLGITEHVIKKVGDGTTTAVQLSYLIYKELCERTERWEKAGFPPYAIISEFQKVVGKITEKIRSSRRELTLDDIKQICLISTNGNEMVSEDIAYIYKKFGKDTFIQIGTSNTESSILKTYDGIILNKGFSSPSFINTNENTVKIPQANIYYFPDPVDTPEMIQLFMQIFTENIYMPYQEGTGKYKPTVILAPSLSQDISSALMDMEKIFYAFDKAGQKENKPPFCIITGINDRVDNIGDIITLCGCPLIKKYINPDTRLQDIENGVAPSVETVTNFAGYADEVTIDIDKMTIVNPKEMFDKDAEIAEDGSRPFSATYNSLISFLEKQIEIESQDKNNLNAIIELKRRLHSLTANFVEYNVGGISAADRDNVRDLVEDAVLNCRSAAVNGVGQGAGIEGLCASKELIPEETNSLFGEITVIIYNAYKTLVTNLYKSGLTADEAEDKVTQSVEKHKAYNLREKSFNGNEVLCSIETDISVLEGISRIITIMYTSNQAFLVDPMQNAYIETND